MTTNHNEKDNYKAAPIPENLKQNERIAMITGSVAEDLEFFYPYYRFNEAGYCVDMITEKGGSFDCKAGLGLHNSMAIDRVNPDHYALLYLPGGHAPSYLKDNKKVLDFVTKVAESNKPISAICHGPQILAAAGLIKGKKIAAWPEMKEEIEKAGAIFADEALQEDGQFITARRPGDLHRHLWGTLTALEKSLRPL